MARSVPSCDAVVSECRRAGPPKLGPHWRSVNSLLAAWCLVAAACHPPRQLPGVPPGTWRTLLGDAGRSAYAAETVPTTVRIVWRKSVGRGITAALQVHGDVLVATTTGRTAVTLRADDGMQYWSYGFRSAIAGSVLKKDHRLIIATGDRDGRVHALEITRGRRLWSRSVGAVRVEPVLVQDRIVIATEEGRVASIAESDGAEVWRMTVGAPPAIPPTASEGMVLVATLADSLFVLDADRGRVLARRLLPASASAPALLRPDMFILPLQTGEVVAFALPSLEVIWRVSLNGQRALAAPVTTGNGAIALLTRDAALWRIEASGQATRIAALGGAATGSLTAAANGFIVGKLDGSLTHLDPDGELIWQIQLGESIVAPVAIRSGAVYVALFRGHVVKLQ